jgi:hypothetical protein
MNPTPRPFWKRQMLFGQLLLAIVFGVMIFVGLNIASAGILTSVLILGGFFVLFGLVQYALWGRALAEDTGASTPEIRGPKACVLKTGPTDEFSLGLNEQERRELLKILEQSVAEPRRSQPPRREDEANKSRMAIRRELLDRLRMYGA